MANIIYIRKRSLFTPIYYGLLYNWDAATYSTGGAGIAPSGWHVPTLTEVETLRDYLGDATTAGEHIKEALLIYWNDITYNDNSSGLSLRGSGYRAAGTGGFGGLLDYGMFWTSTTFSGIFKNSVTTDVSNTNFYTYNIPTGMAKKTSGIPIRLIKDDSTDPGSMTDYDGNVYPTIKIGDQVWMAQNLIVTHFNDGTIIPWYGADAANYFTDAEWAALTTVGCCAYANTLTNVAPGFSFPA